MSKMYLLILKNYLCTTAGNELSLPVEGTEKLFNPTQPNPVSVDQ